jgi:predicted DNA-binding transcriptional regulator YafY
VPEDASGAAVLVRPRSPRAPARSPVTAPVDPFAAPRMSTPRLLGIIEDMRRGDAAARAARRAPATLRANGTVTAQAHTEAMAVLQQAVRDRALVWVRYLDAHGASTTRLVRPVSIGAGYLRAEDERTDTLHTFALHRITAATRDG